jgi:phosphate:Na+ symporter
MIHLLFNVFGVLIFATFFTILFKLRPDMGAAGISSVGISIFFTGFSIARCIIMYPFADKLVDLSGVLVKEDADGREEDTEESLTLRHLDRRILETPSYAVENAILEVVHMGRIVQDNLQNAIDAVLKHEVDKIEKVYETEKTINAMEKMITEYLVKISNLALNEDQHTIVNNLFYSVSDIERVGDHAENIAELVDTEDDHRIQFSDGAMEEMKEVTSVVMKAFDCAIRARADKSVEEAAKVGKYEDMVDTMEEELREKHIERLSKQLCSPENGVVFLDILSNLERISDHAYNLAGYVISEH